MSPTIPAQADPNLDRTFRRSVVKKAAQASAPADAYQLMRLVLDARALDRYRKEVAKNGGDPTEALYALFVLHLAASDNPQSTGAPVTEPVRRRRRPDLSRIIDPNQLPLFPEPPTGPAENN